eukprot:Nk52_evm9s2462 gene=Nk52_evmTU9s2462
MTNDRYSPKYIDTRVPGLSTQNCNSYPESSASTNTVMSTTSAKYRGAYPQYSQGYSAPPHPQGSAPQHPSPQQPPPTHHMPVQQPVEHMRHHYPSNENVDERSPNGHYHPEAVGNQRYPPPHPQETLNNARGNGYQEHHSQSMYGNQPPGYHPHNIRPSANTQPKYQPIEPKRKYEVMATLESSSGSSKKTKPKKGMTTDSSFYNYKILDGTPKRTRMMKSFKSSTPDKSSKGLRHFSLKVCEKVEQKVVTTYNEVADELVSEFASAPPEPKSGHGHFERTFTPSEGHYDQKNIRRRVYDALNVLMAMGIISKQRKEITWIGLPVLDNSDAELGPLEEEKKAQEERIQAKRAHIRELIVQHSLFSNLVKRNKKHISKNGGIGSPSNIQLPFIIVNTKSEGGIECEMSEQRDEFFFKFDQPFEIHDDVEIMKRMGLAGGLESGKAISDDVLKAIKEALPSQIHSYVDAMASEGVVSEIEQNQGQRGSEQGSPGPSTTEESDQASPMSENTKSSE